MFYLISRASKMQVVLFPQYFQLLLSVSHIMQVYGHHLKEHAQRRPN